MSSSSTHLPFAIREWEFEFQQRAQHPVLMADLWCRALATEYERAMGLQVGGLDYLFTGLSKGYVKTAQKRRVLEALRAKLEMRDGYLEDLLRGTEAAVEEFERFVEKVGGERDWDAFVNASERLIPWFYIPWYLTEENVLTERVRAGLERHREKVEEIADRQMALAVLCSPKKTLVLQEEQELFFALVEYAQRREGYASDAGFLSQAEEHVRRFGWMKTFFVLPIEPLTVQELIGRVEVALRERALETYGLQKEEKVRQHVLRERLHEMLHQDEELLGDISAAQELSWVLTWSVERSLSLFAQLIPFYRAVTRAIGVPYQKWVHLTVDEVTRALDGHAAPSLALLDQRARAYVFLCEGNQSTLAGGEEAEGWTNEIETALHAVPEDITELRGQVACPGTMVGRVRIARFASDSYHIKVGEVLVCSMTSPDYVPAMQRAAAIVTDEGGLLSHASIVSRELGKPCVVGTKVATRVLHDGDLVEVRAGEGVVKILEHVLQS